MLKLAAAALLLAAASAPALAAEDGAALFKAKCSACHGPDGKGETTMGKALKVKSLVGAKHAAKDIEKVVTEGKPGTKMTAVRGLTPEQVTAVSAYAASLK